MGLILFEGFPVAYDICYANDAFDAGAGDSACGSERPTCSEMLGRCCSGILSAASCSGGVWICDADHMLTSECSFDLAAAVRREYGDVRAEDFCTDMRGDAGAGDAGVGDAGVADATPDGG